MISAERIWNNMTKKEINDILDTLEKGPELIKLAKEIMYHLPNCPIRDDLSKNLKSVKTSLIKLDVCLEDIQWSLSRFHVLEEEKNNK